MDNKLALLIPHDQTVCNSAAPYLLLTVLWHILANKIQRNRRKEAERNERRMRQILEEHRRRVLTFRMRQSRIRAQFLFLLSGACILKRNPQRKIWSHPRDKQFWEFIVQRTFTELDWLENFRMSKKTFDYLCEQLAPAIHKQNTIFRKAIPVEQRLAVTIWYLATGAEYKTISQLFGISKSALCNIIKEVCKAILDVFWQKYITIPKDDDNLKNLALEFENKWKIPSCIGVLSTTHIPIASPAGGDERYCNATGSYSIILQVLVDHKYCFLDVCANFPGSMSIPDVLHSSDFYKKAQQGYLVPSFSNEIETVSVPLTVLGEETHPLLNWLIVPYCHQKRMSHAENTFNNILKVARTPAVEALMRLKARWQFLQKRSNMKTEDIPIIITVCCVLHNICENSRDTFNSEWVDADSDILISSQTHSDNKCDESAIEIRDVFKRYLINTKISKCCN